MKELKTQKEILAELQEIAKNKDIVIDGYRFYKRERQEAIKWIKRARELRKDNIKLGEESWKDFFNIEESELE